MPFIVVDKQSKLLKTPSIDKCQRLFVKLDFFFSYGNTTTQTSSLNQTNPKFTEVSHWDKPAHTMFLKSDIRQNLERHNKNFCSVKTIWFLLWRAPCNSANHNTVTTLLYCDWLSWQVLPNYQNHISFLIAFIFCRSLKCLSTVSDPSETTK